MFSNIFMKILIGLMVAALLIAGFRFFMVHKAIKDLQTTSLGVLYGPDNAKDILVEILDYRCAFCRLLGPDIAEFARKNPDVRVVVRHFPIFGEPSVREARYALAASKQGKLLEAHNALLGRTEPASDDDLAAISSAIGVDHSKIIADMDSAEIEAELLRSYDSAAILGINRTPSFLINGKIFMPDNYWPKSHDFEKFFGRAGDAPLEGTPLESTPLERSGE